ncbi:MAG TPA: permease-like cell division protein FtsX [Gemmatimonadaceae bacterium]|nr:permease-like cell division protein FtsX [Gemmatimonadaceae bacterium]
MRALREALIAFRRAPLLSVLGIVTIAFSLFAVGLFGLVATNIRETLSRVEERVEIRAYVAEGTAAEAIAAAVGDIGDFPEVARVDFVSQEAALSRARRELPEFRDVYEGTFLPASIDVRMRPGYRDPAQVRSVAARIRTYPFVDDLQYGEEWVEKLARIRNIAGLAGLALGLAFAVVAIMIIGTTIRMAVLARSREISIMRLVGATDSFIRRPFLIEGFVKGILGGGFALLLTWLASLLISRYIVRTTFFDPSLATIGVVGGAIIGLLGSLVSVGRHLRRI